MSSFELARLQANPIKYRDHLKSNHLAFNHDDHEDSTQNQPSNDSKENKKAISKLNFAETAPLFNAPISGRQEKRDTSTVDLDLWDQSIDFSKTHLANIQPPEIPCKDVQSSHRVSSKKPSFGRQGTSFHFTVLACLRTCLRRNMYN